MHPIRKRRNQRWMAREDNLLHSLKTDGASDQECAERLGRTRASISMRWQKHLKGKVDLTLFPPDRVTTVTTTAAPNITRGRTITVNIDRLPATLREELLYTIASYEAPHFKDKFPE